MIDTHCHLDLPDFGSDLEQVIQRAVEAGFDRFLVPGIEFATIERIKSLAECTPAIFFASGIHPNNAAELPEDWAERVEEDARHPKCLAIGEIGLDFYREYCPPEQQLDAFRIQLEIAERLDLPVIIHCRQAYEILWPILSAWLERSPRNRAVLHAFDEDAEKALTAVDAGCMLGIGGTYTYTKKNERRIAILKAVPIEHILLETDCPYLTPVPHRGERNEPAFAALTAAKIAEIKRLPLAEVDRITTRNAERFFGIGSERSGFAGS